MTRPPRVTIVVPLFNDEDTVAEALESCLRQTMTDVEVICVDDASSDTTPDVIERYRARDARIRHLSQETNRSAFQARRRGILAAQGEYILFLDGDDELLPDAAEKAYAAAAASDADLVGFGTEVRGAAGNTVGGYEARLAHKHGALSGERLLAGLFPTGRPAQGQLWRYLFRAEVLRRAYEALPEDLVLPRVNDLPLLFLVAALSEKFISIPDKLYRYYFGRGGSGRMVDTIEQAEFYASAIRSIDSIGPAVRGVARKSADPGPLLDAYESVRLSVIGYVCKYLLQNTAPGLMSAVIDHVHACAPALDIVVATTTFYPDVLPSLKGHSKTAVRDRRQHVLLTTRVLTAGGVSAVLLAQTEYLMRGGYQVSIVARRYGSDLSLVPPGATFIEMTGKGLRERLVEWAEICRRGNVDVVIDHQVLYSRDWPEYALTARTMGIPTIGWLHSFAMRPTYEMNGLHGLLQKNVGLLENLITLSPLDVAFWKLRGATHAAFVPNPPSPMLLESIDEAIAPKRRSTHRMELVWWGRLDEHTKQVSQLLRVAESLKSLSTEFFITVIGPDWGDWTAEKFNAVAAKKGLEGHIRAVGPRYGDELVRAIDRSDAFLSTSIIEGYQLTIAEAQARGLPVFMYELPWLTLLEDNRGVIAVAQGDAEGLAKEIAAVGGDADRYTALSAESIAAAKRALSYDFGQLYEQVVAGTLPAAFSPEPTLDDARMLLDLTIYYGEHSDAARAQADAKSSSKSTRRGAGEDQRSARARARIRARRRAKTKTSVIGAPSGSSIGHRAWRTASPMGRILLQVFPQMRPIAHRVKLRLLRRAHSTI
jgi:glycosyltransferase involved in cell wall biosynthesis